MTKVQAVIREEQLEAVLERLALIGVRDVVIGPVFGAGRSKGRREVFRGGAYQVTLLPKVQLEWCGPESQADGVVRAIEQRARTGKIGDGKIFLQHVEETLSIDDGGPRAI